MAKTLKEEIEKQAAAIVKQEIVQWQDAYAFITEKIAFQMRNLIRQVRKNYWGIFEESIDPLTKRQKIWVPLTQSVVDSVRKNIDLDAKDINFRAKNPSMVKLTHVLRSTVQNKLDDIGFGEKLDQLLLSLAIDGTAVWKTVKDEEGEDDVCVYPIDLLNIYIDPTSPSIKEAYRFTERTLLNADEVRGMTGWMNTEGIEGSYNLSRTDPQLNGSTNISGKGSKLVDVYELWGMIPKSLITGNPKDTEEVEGHIIVSGLDRAGEERVHLIEENKKNRPYEEAWYTRVPGRWYGKGIGETLMMLQLWINTTVNIRIARSFVSQLGIFKIKKGAGITPQMLSKLAANGAIPVQNMDDIQQLIMQEASQASYKDEDNIYQWSQRVTSAFEAVTGEQLPASTSATATAISSQGAQSQFVLVKEQVGMFIQRWLKNQFIPIAMKGLQQGDIIMITGDTTDLLSIDEAIVNTYFYQQIEKLNKEGKYVNPEEVDVMKASAMEKLKSMGNNRYVELSDKIDWTEYVAYIDITNESFDKAVVANNLMTALKIAPQYSEQIIGQVFDLMGLPPIKPVQQMPTAPMPGQAPQPGQDVQQLMTGANTMQGQSING